MSKRVKITLHPKKTKPEFLTAKVVGHKIKTDEDNLAPQREAVASVTNTEVKQFLGEKFFQFCNLAREPMESK